MVYLKGLNTRWSLGTVAKMPVVLRNCLALIVWTAAFFTAEQGHAQTLEFEQADYYCSTDNDLRVEIQGITFPISSVTWTLSPSNAGVVTKESNTVAHIRWTFAAPGQSVLVKAQVVGPIMVRNLEKTIVLERLPSTQGTMSPAGEIDANVPYTYGVQLAQPAGVAAYRWYIDGNFKIETTEPSAVFTLLQVGFYNIQCKLVNRCGQETSSGPSTQVEALCTGLGSIPIEGPHELCPNENTVLVAHAPATALRYTWYKNNVRIPDAAGPQLTINQPGKYTVYVEFSDRCPISGKHDVIVISPPASPITAVKGLNFGFTGKPTLLEVVGGDDATSFSWRVVGSTEDGFTDVGGAVPFKRALFTPKAAGYYTLEVTPRKGGCAPGVPFETKFKVLSVALMNPDSIVLHHPDLSSHTDGYLYLPHHNPNYPGCFEKLGPVTLNVSLDLGWDYNFGKNPFKGDVRVEATAFSDTPGDSTKWEFTLHIDQDAPEQLFSRRMIVAPNLIRFFRIRIKDYTAPVASAATFIRLKATYEEENIVNVGNVSLLNLEHPAAGQSWEQTFRWTRSCPDIPDYVFQLLKQYGTSRPDISLESTWKDALLIHTESSDTTITLSMGEGSGTYFWRVIPLGNKPGGIAEPSNWGRASYPDPSSPLAYVHPEAGKNWIYNRTFTEGNRVGEKVTYADGLFRARQQVSRMQGGDGPSAVQTIQDYTGRNAVTSLPIPLGDAASLMYSDQLLIAKNEDANAPKVPYRAAQFDGLETPVPATDKNSYYNGGYLPAIKNGGVPDAEGYPFSQTVFSNDGTGKIQEQTGVGLALSKKGGHTVRAFFSRPSEAELVSMFGSEAPDSNSVQKVVTYDPNNVAQVTYQTKDGKIIATALAYTEDNSQLGNLASTAPSKTTFFEEVKNNQRVNDFTVVSRTPLFLTEPGNVDVTYEITPAQLQELCSSQGTSAMVGNYTMESNMRDQSGRNNHGSVSGATPAADADGRVSAYALTGAASSYLQVDDRGDLDFGDGDFTVAFWIKRANSIKTTWSNAAGVSKVANIATTGSNEWGLLVRSGADLATPMFFIECGNAVFKTVASTSLVQDQWYHITGVRQGKQLRIYVNGKQEGDPAVITGSGRVNNRNLPLQIGRMGSFNTAGAFDDVQVYRRALSADEIQQLQRRTTLCTTCDYTVSFKLLKDGLPVAGVVPAPQKIAAGQCKDQVAQRYATQFSLPLLGGTKYTLEKYLTLNNKTGGNDTPTYLDEQLSSLEATYRSQMESRLAKINGYIDAKDYAGLYRYLDNIGTPDNENEQYVVPLLPEGTQGCQRFIIVPKIAACPKEDSLTANCTMNGQSYEAYMRQYYAGNTTVENTMTGNQHLYFKNRNLPAGQQRVVFAEGQFDTMVRNLLDEYGQDTLLTCEKVWNAWKREVMGYEPKLKFKAEAEGLTGQDAADYAEDLAYFGTPEAPSLVESFLTSLEAEMQRYMKEKDDFCAEELFIKRTQLYGFFRNNGETAGQTVNPDLDHAYRLAYYNENDNQQRMMLKFYASNTYSGTPQQVKEWIENAAIIPTSSHFAGLTACDQYKFSINTKGSGDNQSPDEDQLQQSISKIRDKCDEACEGRAEEFRQAIINSLFKQAPNTVIEHYNVYKDNVYHLNLWVGVLDSTKNTAGYTLQQCQLEEMVAALVNNCKVNYCNTSMTPYDSIYPGKNVSARRYGTRPEVLKIKKAMTYKFEVKVNLDNQTCASQWDYIRSGPYRWHLNKALLEGDVSNTVFKTDTEGNYYSITPLPYKGNKVALQTATKEVVYVTNTDNAQDLLIAKFDIKGNLVWWHHYEARLREEIVHPDPNAVQRTQSLSTVNVAPNGTVYFFFETFLYGPTDYYIDGGLAETYYPPAGHGRPMIRGGSVNADGLAYWRLSTDWNRPGQLGTFMKEDKRGYVYVYGSRGYVVYTPPPSNNFMYTSDAVELYCCDGFRYRDPIIVVDDAGYTYFMDEATDREGNMRIKINGSVIETLNSPSAVVLIKFDPNGHYMWHQAWETKTQTKEAHIRITSAENSAFLVYDQAFTNQLVNGNEPGVIYNMGGGVTPMIGSTEIIGQSFNRLAMENDFIAPSLPEPMRYNDDIDYLMFKNGSQVSYKYLLKTTGGGGHFLSPNIVYRQYTHFYVAQGPPDVLPRQFTDITYTDKPFRLHGPPMPGFSELPKVLTLVNNDSTILDPVCNFPSMCFRFTEPGAEVTVPTEMKDYVYNPDVIPCEDITASTLRNTIGQQVEQLVSSQLSTYRDLYYGTCADPMKIDDKLTLTKGERLHYFTLYYFDRAGNLVRTVPPEGFVPKTVSSATTLASAKTSPAKHRMVTEYQYNALGQLVRQHSPDGNLGGDYVQNSDGSWKFVPGAAFLSRPSALNEAAMNASPYYNTQIFNSKGLVRYARNARQKLEGSYSYTKYDSLGNIIEIGEATGYNEAAAMLHLDEIGRASYPADVTRRSITQTVYTTHYGGSEHPALPVGYIQDESGNNLRNRVSYTYLDQDGQDNTLDDRTYTVYDYDPHGNVQWMAQLLPGLPAVAIRYEYDLLTGRVNQLQYNPGTSDEFYHRYEYDADNRISKVQTSRDGHIWETDARYRYYPHGPLKRVELGEDLLQGTDYTYTTQGWMKGVNHGLLDKTSDPGKDGEGSSLVGRDAFGMGLNYYAGDYNHTGSSHSPGNEGNIIPSKNLYNGNISASTSRALQPAGISLEYPQLTGYQYSYDKLNRLLRSDMYYYNTTGTTKAFTQPSALHYTSMYTYSLNGNLKSATNYMGATSNSRLLDQLTYTSEIDTINRLSYVEDAAPASGFDQDAEMQQKHNYKYDAIGNLVRDEQQDTRVYWNVYGKVDRVERRQNGNLYTTSYLYDSRGNRVSKRQVAPTGLSTTNYYVRDAGGNVMAVYEKVEQVDHNPEILLTELPIYGSDRLGMYMRSSSQSTGGDQTPAEQGELRITRSTSKDEYEQVSYLLNSDVELTIGPGFSYASTGGDMFRIRAGVHVEGGSGQPQNEDIYTRRLNSRRYELKDHLGNVRVLITDVKLSTYSANALTDYRPEVVGIYNHYPFGMAMPGRTWESGGKYRYGFNGKEKDQNGEWGGVAYDYGFRIYTPAIGKFLSIDPLTGSYPMLTPYQFASNRPIDGVDLDGLEYLESDEARVEFKYGRLDIKLENFHSINANAFRQASEDTHNWGPTHIGLSTTIAEVRLSRPHKPRVDLALEKGLKDLAKFVKPNTSLSADAMPDLPNINKNALEDGLKSDEGTVTHGQTQKLGSWNAKVGGTLSALTFIGEQYLFYIANDDRGKVYEHRDLAMRAADDVNIAIELELVDDEYLNPTDLANIMNVVLQGVNNTKNQKIYEIGMRIYNTISTPYIISNSTANGPGSDATRVNIDFIRFKPIRPKDEE